MLCYFEIDEKGYNEQLGISDHDLINCNFRFYRCYWRLVKDITKEQVSELSITISSGRGDLQEIRVKSHNLWQKEIFQ